MCYAEWKEKDSKCYILHGFTYMTFWKRQMIGTENKRSEVARGLRVGEEVVYKGTQGIFWGDGNALYRDCDCGGSYTTVWIW